ncbi:restriction endonuclease subunit S [Streptomyces sp. NPDC127098]|uniref:restriction endonuclease subunit S n=1 Tax=Streptomyces sp. NPDC127098 TaxID=3347137 RepID=UPI003656AC36
MTVPQVTTLGELLRRGGGSIRTGPFGTALRASEYSDTGVPVISVGEIGHGRLCITSATPRVGPSVVKRMSEYVLRANDIVFGRKGAVDRSARVLDSQEGYFLGSDGIRVRLGTAIDPLYMVYVLQSTQVRDWIVQHATGTTMASLNQKILSRLPLCLPSVERQRAIGQVLAEADDSIAALERMIAKKQAVKQGTMQQLLAGRTRLPGFTGELAEHRLSDVSIKIQDGTHFSPRLGGSSFKYITSKNIGFGVMKLETVETISESEHRKIYSRCDTRFGDLLITKDGANTGNAALNPFREEISLLSSVAFLRCDPQKASEAYILQYLLSSQGRQQIKNAMAGNAITRLTLAKIRDLVVPMPGIDEQRALAQVLGDADGEILALHAKLRKMIDVKRGMMQRLLNRLPDRKGAA